MSDTEVLIIGAGPAGLALGWHLRESGLALQILEQNEVGGSWLRMPRDFDLITPSRVNDMPGMSNLPGWHGGRMSCNEYGDLLRHYASEYDLPVMEQAPASSIVRDSDSDTLHVGCRAGSIESKVVVSASGYFMNPYSPTIPDDGSIPSHHVFDLDRALEYARRKGGGSVLIVGKRISAGQVMLLFHDLGWSVTMSASPPIVHQPDRTPARRVREWLYFPWEEAKARARLLPRQGSYPGMQGDRARQLVQEGVVDVAPRPTGVSGGSVVLDDGTRRSPDLIVHATGFRPALDYMNSAVSDENSPSTARMMSTEVDGLYFLGIDNLMNFRSRYLRGVRHDAEILARVLRHRLSQRPATSDRLAGSV